MAKVTHGDIADMIDGVKDAVNDLRDDVSDVGRDVQDLKRRIGHDPNEGGEASGLTARLIAIENRLGGYDRLKERILGGAAAIAFAWIVFWWLVGDKISAIFRPPHT